MKVDSTTFGDCKASKRLAELLEEYNNPVHLKRCSRTLSKGNELLFVAVTVRRRELKVRFLGLAIREVKRNIFEDLQIPEPIKSYLYSILIKRYSILVKYV